MLLSINSEKRLLSFLWEKCSSQLHLIYSSFSLHPVFNTVLLYVILCYLWIVKCPYSCRTISMDKIRVIMSLLSPWNILSEAHIISFFTTLSRVPMLNSRHNSNYAPKLFLRTILNRNMIPASNWILRRDIHSWIYNSVPFLIISFLGRKNLVLPNLELRKPSH